MYRKAEKLLRPQVVLLRVETAGNVADPFAALLSQRGVQRLQQIGSREWFFQQPDTALDTLVCN
jgi:hypothetical protein